MDALRIGRQLRALRRHRGWRQEDLGRAARVSRNLVSRIEQSRGDRITVASLDRIATAVGARLIVRLDWNGEDLDRLIDARHASLVEAVIGLLSSYGWICLPEVTFNVYGERGSVDILAYHEPTRTLLIVEVKTVVPDLGSSLMVLDRKTRLGPELARRQRWNVANVARLMVIAEGPTARRRVAQHSQTFANAFPVRGVAVRRWLAAPSGSVSGLLFFSDSHQAATRRRVRTRQ
jgi:transcriptional regulator with XRE-family HTH domain